jgi:hypothetical protein
MRISGITVCVDYSEFLGQSLARWRRGLDELLVVTSPTDIPTKALCSAHGTPFHATEVFWARGAKFNKAGALNEALQKTGIFDRAQWFLFFDADVIPPADWRHQLEHPGQLVPGNLYGAGRADERGEPIPDTELAGYFQLFHAADPAVRMHAEAGKGVALEEFTNAGCYDSCFMRRWPAERRLFVPSLMLTHLGERGVNWCGIGNREAMSQLRSERRRRGGWQHERL